MSDDTVGLSRARLMRDGGRVYLFMALKLSEHKYEILG